MLTKEVYNGKFGIMPDEHQPLMSSLDKESIKVWVVKMVGSLTGVLTTPFQASRQSSRTDKEVAVKPSLKVQGGTGSGDESKRIQTGE